MGKGEREKEGFERRKGKRGKDDVRHLFPFDLISL